MDTPNWNDFLNRQIANSNDNFVAGVVLRIAGSNGALDCGAGRVTAAAPGIFCIRVDGNDGKKPVKQDRYFAASDVLFVGVIVPEVATRLVT